MGDGRRSERAETGAALHLLAFLMAVALSAFVAVTVDASGDGHPRESQAHTQTETYVVGHYLGDVPSPALQVDLRQIPIPAEVTGSFQSGGAVSGIIGGTTPETFAPLAGQAQPPSETSSGPLGSTARLAALEMPVLPKVPSHPREPAGDTAASSALAPPPRPAGQQPVEPRPSDPELVLAMLAPPWLLQPPVDLRPSPEETPLLEPFMEMFEDWVTRTPMNRHPGFYKVHFAPNVQGRCLPKTLLNVLYDVGMKFGDVKVISGYRSRSHNRAVGGASRSLHMECRAIDFFVTGAGKGVLEWLVRQKAVGGYKRYPFGSFHIDNGPRRTWAWGKRKKRRR
jgi:hypothetical protein